MIESHLCECSSTTVDCQFHSNRDRGVSVQAFFLGRRRRREHMDGTQARLLIILIRSLLLVYLSIGGAAAAAAAAVVVASIEPFNYVLGVDRIW